MWKRDRRETQSLAPNNPTACEPFTNKPLPQPSTDLNDSDFSISSRPAFGRKATGDVLKELPGLPDSLQMTPAIPRRPVSTVPTASSVYSQPSFELNRPMTPTSSQIPRSSTLYPEDVSPPDSPTTNGRSDGHSRKSSFNVSPISTENPSPFASRTMPLKQSGSRYNSNLPVPRKNTKKFWKLPDKASVSPNQEAASTTVRWDEYSGEPTSSEKGKPPSTTPGEVKLHEDPTSARLNTHSFGTSTYVSSGGIARKRVGTRELSDAPILLRPQWKGAGGRHAIVPAPIDKPLPAGQSPKFPMGQQRKQQIEAEELAERERLDEERFDVERTEQEQFNPEREERPSQEEERINDQRREKQRAEQARLDKDSEDQDRRTRERIVQARKDRDLAQQAQKAKAGEDAAASKQRKWKEAAQMAQIEQDVSALQAKDHAGKGNGLGLAFHPASQGNHQTDEFDLRNASHTGSSGVLYDPPANPMDKRSPLARNPSREEMQQPERPAQTVSDVPLQKTPQQRSPQTPSARDQRPAWKPRTSSLPKDGPVEQDPNLIESRFRANLQNMTISEEPKSRFSTTTYATTSYNDSPPHTPEMTSESPSVSSGALTADSILNRRRPVPLSGVPNAKSARKPTPIAFTPQNSSPGYLTNSAHATNSDSHSKILPKAPAGQPKVDQVKTLQAKQDALRRRKRNIETVIHELTDVVQPSSIAYDKASRQEIKKTVEQLKQELAEVLKDEYETGLKLHRAWKRHDDFANFEPTSIWVRRVTG